MSEKAPTNETEIDDRIERLEEENEMLRDRLAQLEATLPDEEVDDSDGGSLSVTRRGAMTGAAGLGLLGFGATGTAAAASFGDELTGEAGPGNQGFRVYNSRGYDAASGSFTGDTGGRAILAELGAADGTAFAANAFNTSGNLTAGVAGRTASDQGQGIRGINQSRLLKDEGAAVQGELRADTPLQSGEPEGVIQDNSPAAIRGVVNVDEVQSSASPAAIKATSTVTTGASNVLGMESDHPVMAHDDVVVDSGGDVRVKGSGSVLVEGSGNLEVAGTKHFAHAVETPQGQKKVRYTSVEAGQALTEHTGVTEMEDGRAEIELPDHYQLVTSDEEPVSVQVTPYAKDEVKPQVVEQSSERVVIEDFSEEAGEYTFAYTVKGVRDGYENEEIIVDDE